MSRYKLDRNAHKDRHAARESIVTAANRVRRNPTPYTMRHLQKCVHVMRAQKPNKVNARMLKEAGFNA